ncbi:cytochrome c peroxidase, mitochondrial [Trichomonascus vanleenenianus]|uniref:peroxidase n=1 Tax=Trichomonascus vanleenenianus TaxID=2268995 RepID=UPI003EC9F151
MGLYSLGKRTVKWCVSGLTVPQWRFPQTKEQSQENPSEKSAPVIDEADGEYLADLRARMDEIVQPKPMARAGPVSGVHVRRAGTSGQLGGTEISTPPTFSQAPGSPPRDSNRPTHPTSRGRRRRRIINNFIMASNDFKPTAKDYEAVKQAVLKVMPREDYDDGSTGPVLVRLAWHACGTYDKATGTGGSNGATMRYYNEAMDDANKGLECARLFLEPVKNKFPWISYADLWTFAGAAAVEAMGGPKIPWKPGRVDYVDEENVPPNGRLPDGALAQDHVRSVFYRMGFNDQEIVALCGAHNLGRTHANRSGFDGPWVPNPTRFSNTYYKLLLNEEWKLGKSPAGLPQYYDEDGDLMMLPADMCLIQDPKFRVWVEKYADDKDLFFSDFAKVFGKLLELGVRRDKNGVAKINYINKVNNPEPAKL